MRLRAVVISGMACGLAVLWQGCELLAGDDPKTPLEEVADLVEGDFDYDAVKPLGTYFPPGTILDAEDSTITATVADCFGSEVVLSTITTDTILNAGWKFESEDAAGGVAGGLLGVKLTVNTSVVKSLHVEVATLNQEMISETEIDRRARGTGIDPHCRRRIESGAHRIVLAALRVEGLRLKVTTQQDVTIELDTGNLNKYLNVQANLQQSAMGAGAIAPAEPVYVGYRAVKLWELPANPPVINPPKLPLELEPMQRDEPALWCCDLYGRARCALDQPGIRNTLCQCDSEMQPGNVCETEPEEVPAAVTADVDITDPCTVITGGPTVACGATLSTELGPNTLFLCHDRRTIGAAPCATRCHVAAPGAHDFCEDDDPCANATRDGASCGANLAPEPWAEPRTLYHCVDRRTAQQEACTNVPCVTGGPGMDDFCLQSSPPASPGPGGSPPESGG